MSTPQSVGVVSRALRPARFVRVIVTMTLLVQLPGAALLGATLWSRGVALPALWALVALAVANVPLFLRIAEGLADRPTSAARLYGLDLPYFTLWGTCFGFLFLAPAAWIVAVVAGLPVLPALQGAFAVAGGVGAYAVWIRRHLVRTRRVDVRVRDLSPSLDGYRIVQLSDLHVGSHVPPARAARWVARANAMRPDLVALTGDLISSGSAFLEAVASTLGALRARDGVFFSPGNHDYFCDHDRLFALLREAGIEVLQNAGRLVSRDGASLFVAGADDVWRRHADVERALAGRPLGAPAVLLAHDPRLWAPARALGATLTLSGHTHGGQVALPFFSRRVNLARTTFAQTSGAYRDGDAWLVVSNGLGTTGPPARLGSAPEIVEITLRAG